jgi:Flp pilus assembly pilin Flp
MNQHIAAWMVKATELWRDEAAVTSIEYGLLAALIAVACIAAFAATGGSVGDVYEYWSSRVIAALAIAGP